MKGWKQIIGAVAPTLATALGGPLAGMAVKEIAGKVLGKPEANEAEVAQAIGTAGPDTIVKLKELDQAFAARMAELAIDLEKIDQSDRADARARQVAMRDWTPTVLAIANATAFFILLFLMLNHSIPDTNRSAFDILLGMLGGSLGTVMTYYFGSSRGSHAKDEILGRAAGKS